MELSDNELVTLLLCSNLAAERSNPPLSDTFYSLFARSLFKAERQPSDLFTMNNDEITEVIKADADLSKLISRSYKGIDPADKILALLKRHQQLYIALGLLEKSGIKVLTRANRELYPKKLYTKLRKAKIPLPSVIYYVGDITIVDRYSSVAVVGSRNFEKDKTAEVFTDAFVKKAVDAGYAISSGGAKGIDICSQQAAMKYSASYIITVADSLLKKIMDFEVRKNILDEQAVFLSLVNPEESFKAYNAMARNKIIYAVADYGLVVTSDYQTKKQEDGSEVILAGKGGTWVGVHECYEKNLSKIMVRSNDADTPRGNAELLRSLNGIIEIRERDVLSECDFTDLLHTCTSLETETHEKDEYSLF